MKTLSSDFKGKFFLGLKNLDYSVIMKNEIEVENILKINHGIVYLLFRLLYNALIKSNQKYTFEINKKSEILFFKSSFASEKRFEMLMRKIMSCCEYSDFLFYDMNKQDNNLWNNIMQFMRMIFIYYPSWFKAMKDIDLKERFFFMNSLFYLFILEQNLKVVDLSKYKILTVFLDTLILDSYLVLVAKKANIVTSTIQHGIFRAARREETSLSDWELELKNGVSDYFMAWNNFTVNEGKKAGNMITEFKVVGIPEFIGVDDKCIKPENNIFGVVLAHPVLKEDNIKIIRLANLIAEKYEYFYYVKYHPHCKGYELDNVINKKYYKGRVNSSEKLVYYVNMVEFTLVGNTSLVVEMAYLCHPFAKIVFDKTKEIYSNVNGMNLLNYTDSIFDLDENFIDRLKSDNPSLVFNELCSVKNVKESYADFYRCILNK